MQKKKKIATILTFVIKNWKLRKYIENIFWRNFRKFLILTIVLQFLTCVNALHTYVTSNSLQVIPYKVVKEEILHNRIDTVCTRIGLAHRYKRQRQYTRTGTFRWRETGAWANARIFLRGRLVQLHRRREIYAWPLNSFPRTCCRSPHFKRVRLRKFLFAMNAALRLRVPLIAKISSQIDFDSIDRMIEI